MVKPIVRDMFFIYTHGAPAGGCLKRIRAVSERKRCKELGEYRCRGFDTFGPFKLMGGLPTPRIPSEIRDGIVTAKDGRIVDREFRKGAAKCLEIALREQPDLIILQSRSPSCGVKQRYDGFFSGKLVDGFGVTAELLIKNGFRVIDVEDFDEYA